MKKQSDALVREDDWRSSRLRAMLLCQIWSISRFDDIMRWKFCELFSNVFTTEANSTLKMPIKSIYALQFRHKTSRSNASRSKKPQKKLLVRRTCPLVCPQSSLAYWLFERFLLDGEPNVDVLRDPEEWYLVIHWIQIELLCRYDIQIMRSRANRNRPPSANALREERIKLGQSTNTGVIGLVNHLPRQLGTYLGKPFCLLWFMIND